MKKWTYKELKARKFIEVYIYESNNSALRGMGYVGEQLKEDIPLIDGKKGDFWIDVPLIKQKLLTKAKFVCNNYSQPCVFFKFQEKTRWHLK